MITGKVDKVYDIRKVSVAFERIARQDVSTQLVLPIGGAVARPHLMVSLRSQPVTSGTSYLLIMAAQC